MLNYVDIIEKMKLIIYLFIHLSIISFITTEDVDLKKSLVWGPGLNPDQVVLPARYFFIQSVAKNGSYITRSPKKPFSVFINGSTDLSPQCQVWQNILDRKDGSFIVRYKIFRTCTDVQLNVMYNDKHVADSPYHVTGPVYPDDCYCPGQNYDTWLQQFNCKENYEQIHEDLEPFSNVQFSSVRQSLLSRFNSPGSISICHYVVKNNEVFRECFGQYTGFKMFMDAILLSLARKVILPDFEFFMNLGDWPLIQKIDGEVFPMFSWCGSTDTLDIVMPTYDLTEATLENMGRVTLDMLSVQGKTKTEWNAKIEKAFWRGRDSRRERLRLIEIARENPNLINASITNFFFFKDEIEKYGPKENHVSFFEFFDYKYLVNVDGTVASYRLPYLLAGGSLVFKQESPYYEHFYKRLEPWVHYVPIKRDLSDLVERVQWAKNNDEESQKISRGGVTFARENLMPLDIMCYHAVLFKEWSRRLKNPVVVLNGMEHVPQPKSNSHLNSCQCDKKTANKNSKDEL